MRLRKRKASYAVTSMAELVLYNGGPLILSGVGRRHGWDSGPGPANLLGLLPIAGGAALLVWAVVSHYSTAPEEADVDLARLAKGDFGVLVPEYLVRSGAYNVTRNPMYLGGGLGMIGWAALFGSVPIGAVALVFLAGVDRVGIPFEERLLRRKFGESYDVYCAHVARWIGWRRLLFRG